MSKQIVLELKGVSKNYQQGKQGVRALKKTDFTIEAGELVAVIGPSGSGKSTFLTIAGGLQNPTAGKVFINGNDVTRLSLKKLSETRLKEVSFILQGSNLVPYLTVKKQLVLIDKVTRRPADNDLQTELFKSLGIAELADKYPNDLSGGERQRAAIAKALYGSSNLILADEPTASLDSKKAIEVVKILAQVTHERDKATIIVTHDERLIVYCDKVYEMQDGVLRPRAK